MTHRDSRVVVVLLQHGASVARRPHFGWPQRFVVVPVPGEIEIDAELLQKGLN
jgi:hypothetical protein